MSCESECLEHTTALYEELEKLSEENKSIQKALTEIILMMETFTTEKKQYWKDQAVRQREKTW